MDTSYLRSRFGDVIALLNRFGLSDDESISYVVMNMKGTLRASELAESLHMPRTKAYRVMNGLQEKGAVEIVSASPMMFRAHPISSLVSFLLMNTEQSLTSLRNDSKPIVERFETEISSEEVADAPSLGFSFRIMRGLTPILSTIGEMILSSGELVKMVLDSRNLFRVASGSTIIYLLRKIEEGSNISLLSQKTESTEEIVSGLRDRFPIRFVDTQKLPNFVVTDNGESFQFLGEGTNRGGHLGHGPSGFWCNSPSYSSRLNGLFNMLWDEEGKMLGNDKQSLEVN